MGREPVAIVNAAVALIEAAIGLAVALNTELDDAQVAALVAVVVTIGNAIKTFWARKQVTPLDDPKDKDGNGLTPAGT